MGERWKELDDEGMDTKHGSKRINRVIEKRGGYSHWQ